MMRGEAGCQGFKAVLGRRAVGAERSFPWGDVGVS